MHTLGFFSLALIPIPPMVVAWGASALELGALMQWTSWLGSPGS